MTFLYGINTSWKEYFFVTFCDTQYCRIFIGKARIQRRNHKYKLATFQEDFITSVLLYVLRATIPDLFSSSSSGGYDAFFHAIKVTVKYDQLQAGHALAAETHRDR